MLLVINCIPSTQTVLVSVKIVTYDLTQLYKFCNYVCQ